MEAYNPIPDYIREITELPLTKWGQMKLAGFPQEAIQSARQAVRLSPKAREPFGLFFNKALEYCKANNLAVDWKKVDFLKTTYQMAENAPMILATAPTIKKSSTNEVPEDFFKNLAVRVAAVSQEDPYTAALAVERHFAFSPDGQRFVRNVGRENPWLQRLTNDDQKRIMDVINSERTP